MGPQRKVIYALVFAIVVFFIAMAATFIPCQKAPNVPDPQFEWKSCTLNPDLNADSSSQKLFYGYTESLTEAYIITLALSFILAFVVLHYATRARKVRN